MKVKTPRDMAFLLIAACDRPDADDYEKRIVRVSRRWLRILNSPQVSQRMVDKFLEEFGDSASDVSGALWDEMKESVMRWAVQEEWLEA